MVVGVTTDNYKLFTSSGHTICRENNILVVVVPLRLTFCRKKLIRLGTLHYQCGI